MVKLYWVSSVFALLFVSASGAWAQVSVVNDQEYVGDDGVFHIVGEIQNDSGVPFNQVVVSATLYSEDDQILGTAKASTILETIMPDSKGPFDLLFVDKSATLIDRYTLDLEYKPTDQKTQVLEVTSSDSKQGIVGNFIITGTVANHGDITANIVIVIATLYDRDGNVVAVGKAYPEPGYLGTGEETPFAISIPDREQSKKAIDYSLTVESEEHTAVPEFSIASGMLLAASVSAYVLMTRMPLFSQQVLFA